MTVDLVPTVAGYEFAVTCLYDGAAIVPVAQGVSSGTAARAVCKCSVCASEFIVAVELLIGHGQPARTTRRKR